MNRKSEAELLIKIGELYFNNNNLILKHKSSTFFTLTCFISDILTTTFNPIVLLINILIVFFIFLFHSTLQSYFIIIIISIFFIFTLEMGICIPAYCRRSPLQRIQLYYQIVAAQLVAFISPFLYRFICNNDGTVKDFTNSVAIAFITTKIGTILATSFHVDETLLQLIITYLTSKGLSKYCSTPLAEPSLNIVEYQMNDLKKQMIDFFNRENKL